MIDKIEALYWNKNGEIPYINIPPMKMKSPCGRTYNKYYKNVNKEQEEFIQKVINKKEQEEKYKRYESEII